MLEVPPDSRRALQSLYADCPGVSGLVAAVLSGEMGRAWADDLTQPTLAVLYLDFHVFGGRPTPENVDAALGLMPKQGFICAPDSWQDALRRRLNSPWQTYTRYEFESAEWDRRHLQSLVDAVPPGFEMRRADAGNVEALRGLAAAFVYNFDSLEDFLARGLGFGLWHESRFVSGCSSFAIGGGKLEIEIDTAPEFERRGFAKACGAAMILYCLDHDLEPCWDAAHTPSAYLAEAIGFRRRRAYTAWSSYPWPPDAPSA
jgi:GNAT superfamily N-acetyltransferase